MTGKKPEPPLFLDMDFEEALERFIGVEPAELPDDKRMIQKKKSAKATRDKTKQVPDTSS